MVRIMTISVIRFGALLLFCGGLLIFSAAHSEESPHWNKNGCQSCHAESAPTDGVVNLVAEDAEALCESCHGGRGEAPPCRHASGIPAGDVAIADSLTGSLKNGQVVCTTCHDIVFQCERPKAHFRLQNTGFLRDRTSRESGDYCLKCHETTGFERFNPHTGVAGSPAKPTCELCHAAIPHTDEEGALVVAFNMEQDLNQTCQGCHVSRPHPRSMTFGSTHKEEWVHFVEPPDDIRARMLKVRDETGIDLPLDPLSGKVFCATCHDPHEFKGGPVAQQPEHRLRANDICQVCHEK
jgi:predicted CXXCH cytochrome family protein